MTTPPDNTSSPQRPHNIKEGRRGEEIAKEYLVSKGYAIRATNWRSGHYEIDIVAIKGTRVIFVEVKTRVNGFIDPVVAVNSAKRSRTIKAADVYMQTYQLNLEYQFDIISIIGFDNPRIEHIPDAYFPTTRR